MRALAKLVAANPSVRKVLRAATFDLNEAMEYPESITVGEITRIFR